MNATFWIACCLALQTSSLNLPDSGIPSTFKSQAMLLENNGGDPRLSLPVQMQANPRPLRTILEETQRQTGVQIKIEEKWIADLPTIAYTTRPMPLFLFLKRLTRLHCLSMRFDSTSPDNTGTQQNRFLQGQYVLYESRENRRYMEDLIRLSKEIARERILKTLRYLRLPEEQLRLRAKQGDQLAQDMQDRFYRADALLASQLTEQDFENLMEGGTVSIAYSNMNLQAQKAMEIRIRGSERQKNESMRAFIENERANGREHEDYIVQPAPLEKTRLRFLISGEGANAGLVLMFETPTRTTGGRLIGAMGGHENVWLDRARREGRRTVAPERQMETRKVPRELILTTNSWYALVQTMAETWQLNIFSDAYPGIPMLDKYKESLTFSHTTRQVLVEGLSAGAAWQRCCWQEGITGNDILFLRDNWYLRRDRGFSDRLIQRLQQKRKRQEPFSLQDLTDLARLPSVQSDKLANELKLDNFALKQRLDILRFYEGLPTSDRKKLYKSGLGLADLARAQHPLFLRLVQACDATLTEMQTEHVFLQAIDRDEKLAFIVLYIERGHSPRELGRWEFDSLSRSNVKTTPLP